MYFLFSKAGNFETSITRVPYNKLLTNLACSSRTGEYWPSVVFVRTSLRSVPTATTSSQYSPVRPSRSVSKRLIHIEILEYQSIDITKCDNLFSQSATAYFVTKCNKLLLQGPTAILLESVPSVMTKCDRYYKVLQFYYKI